MDNSTLVSEDLGLTDELTQTFISVAFPAILTMPWPNHQNVVSGSLEPNEVSWIVIVHNRS